MNTIQIKDCYKRVNLFLKEGCALFDNTYDNEIIISYKDYLQVLVIKILPYLKK